MGFLEFTRMLFWHKNERRLRALWRLSLHTVILLILTTVFTLGLLFFGAVVNGFSASELDTLGTVTNQAQIMRIPWVGTVLIPGGMLLGVLVSTFLTARWVDKRRFKDLGLRLSKHWWGDFAFGLVLGAFLMGLIFLFGWLTGNLQVSGTFRSAVEGVSFLSGFVQSLILFLFVGVYEEILSRGYHLVNLAEGFNRKPFGQGWALVIAWLLSSLVFGLLHWGNPNATWVSTLNISLAGLFIGLGMVLTGSLAIPIGLHITWNFFQGSVFGFPVSGMRVGSTLLATQAVGPQWLTGGPFGPEAGVLGLGAILIGSLLTILWVRRIGKLNLQTDLASYPDRDQSRPVSE